MAALPAISTAAASALPTAIRTSRLPAAASSSNLGALWFGRFLDAYGMADIDPARLDYYQLLDEILLNS